MATIDPKQVLLAAYDENTAQLRTLYIGTAGSVVEHDLDPAQIWIRVYDPATASLRVASVS
ncbi:hypothetical protein [Azospirillum sp. sgz301742]